MSMNDEWPRIVKEAIAPTLKDIRLSELMDRQRYLSRKSPFPP